MRSTTSIVFLPLLFACVSHDPVDEESVNPYINEAYKEPVVKEWVERFEREGREIYDRRGEIVAAIGLRHGETVADIGAGTGLFTPLLADAVGKGGSVVVVEIVPEFLDYIGRRMQSEGRENVDLILCDERSVCLAPGSVDVAFMCDVYHHFQYPNSSMRSLYGALRPGGQVFLIDFERIEGLSSDWVLDHVRAGKKTFIAEIRAAGFELVEELDMLEKNYVLRFKRPE